jgi:protein-S-isoprenylcysteine O-methyltransferase Ste14
MRPYFDNPVAGGVLMAVVLCWLVVEFAEFLRVQEARAARAGTVKTRNPAVFWLSFVACMIVAEAGLYGAPHVFPAAAIRPGAAAFAAGIAVFVTGAVLRGWSFLTLGKYFSYVIEVSPDQPVVTAGPYRAVRHPTYAGGMLIFLGLGLASANWIGLAAITLLPLAIVIWRIRIEENALLTTLGERYRSYAGQHKRLVPLVW